MSLRQAKPGKGGSDVRKQRGNLSWNSVGSQSHPAKLASGRKRVLRAGPGNRPHEAYTASSEAVLLSPERKNVAGAFVVDIAGAAPTCIQAPDASVPPGSENTA